MLIQTENARDCIDDEHSATAGSSPDDLSGSLDGESGRSARRYGRLQIRSHEQDETPSARRTALPTHQQGQRITLLSTMNYYKYE